MELGPLEMRVLGLLDPREARSVGAVRELLSEQGTDVAYTTVMTVLSRLHDKRAVTREKDSGRYLYRQASRIPAIKAAVLTRVRSALFASDRLRPIAELVQNDLTADELRSLHALVEARLRDKRK